MFIFFRQRSNLIEIWNFLEKEYLGIFKQHVIQLRPPTWQTSLNRFQEHDDEQLLSGSCVTISGKR